ncbi:MAG: molecular chaperone Hsp20 [Planctomycetota bacterium]|nr:MAG: molecular chaperone Hsp20 [Planctomycetota bacterium]
MLTHRLNPFAPFPAVRRELDRVFESVFGNGAVSGAAPAYPALNVWEDGGAFTIEAEIPGVELSDIEVQVAGADVTIKGTRRPAVEGETTMLREERPTGTFSRTLTFPVAVVADQVEATMKNGVLVIRLPKSPEATARKIQIKSN